jgi:hypothetical protein
MMIVIILLLKMIDIRQIEQNRLAAVERLTRIVGERKCTLQEQRLLSQFLSVMMVMMMMMMMMSVWTV